MIIQITSYFSWEISKNLQGKVLEDDMQQGNQFELNLVI